MVQCAERPDQSETTTEDEQVLFKRKPITIHPAPTNVSDNAEVWHIACGARELTLTCLEPGLGHERDQ